MKTLKTYRNTAIMLILGFSLMAMSTPQTPANNDPSEATENEYANAGYWIEPVVVTYDANKEFADAGYWIEPVVVTYDANKEFADAGYWIDPVVVTYDANKEDKTLLAGKGYFIDPVVVTYNPKASSDELASGDLALNQ
jgi:hypothetical protein